MKKLLLITIFVILCVTICGCAGMQGTQVTETPSPAPTATPEPTPEPTPTPTPEPEHEPGPYFEGFELHYADEEGHDIKNGSLGVLNFDENGVYTSGNPELDRLILEELEKNVDPGTQTRSEMLKIMYDYTVWNFGYGFTRGHEQGSSGWEADDALQMLQKRRGNCYAYGALFAMFARNLGYQARGIAGTFKAGEHAWTEIEEDGEYYVCDAEYQACNSPYESRFFHTYEQEHSFNYKNPALD